MGGPFVEYLIEEGGDVYHAKDIIEGHILESSIPPHETLKNLLRLEGRPPKERQEEAPRPVDNLGRYCINMNHEFLVKRNSKISGRDYETNELVEILSKKNKSNAILVGGGGCWKNSYCGRVSAENSESRHSRPHVLNADTMRGYQRNDCGNEIPWGV